MLNALTIDLEDYYHVCAFEDRIERSDWERYPSRVEANTERLLELFDRYRVRATFFVLGWVARHHPRLIRRLAEAGHEIGSHSYWHRLIYRQTPEEFRHDLKESRAVLEDLLASPVTSYRAPTYSITRDSLWALDILADEGFRCDSSIFPIRHDRYGIADAEPMPHRIAGDLWEFPPSVLRVGTTNVPVAGGGYFRLFPASWTAWCIRRLNNQDRPFLFYLHPWEVDPEQPRLPCSWTTHFRHYLNLHSTLHKLERLLKEFRFGPMSAALDEYRRLHVDIDSNISASSDLPCRA